MGKLFEGDLHDVPGAREPCVSVSHAPFGLEAPRPQPLVREGEARATVVVLPVVDPNRASVLEDRAVLRHAVRNAGEEFRQVERRVGVVADPEEEHLAVQLVHPADGLSGSGAE